MGADTLKACKEVGAIYLHAIGGAAVQLAQSVKQVKDVYMLDEFGIPEAFWVCEVEGFRGVVTMDANGRSLHARILAASRKKHKEILGL
jgi:fumarate hydratase subunit beta